MRTIWRSWIGKYFLCFHARKSSRRTKFGEVIKVCRRRCKSAGGRCSTRPEAKFFLGWITKETSAKRIFAGIRLLENRVLFVSVPRDNPAAAWMKINDPIKDFARIQEMVRAGFLVRTRADEPTGQARNNDTRMRDKALASGAQYVSTDYPESGSQTFCLQRSTGRKNTPPGRIR